MGLAQPGQPIKWEWQQSGRRKTALPSGVLQGQEQVRDSAGHHAKARGNKILPAPSSGLLHSAGKGGRKHSLDLMQKKNKYRITPGAKEPSPS